MCLCIGPMQNMMICHNNLINYISTAEVHGFVCDLRPHRSLTLNFIQKSSPPRLVQQKNNKTISPSCPVPIPQKHDGLLPKSSGFNLVRKFWGFERVQLKNAPHAGAGKYIRIIPGLQITPPKDSRRVVQVVNPSGSLGRWMRRGHGYRRRRWWVAYFCGGLALGFVRELSRARVETPDPGLLGGHFWYLSRKGIHRHILRWWCLGCSITSKI